ncbi:hypothetical protein [Actinomadura sp. 6N118]|uniref:hypothetical protein n=1 Tax=Actinomadura sp. 6N118 TaxID=3375151 RepID=UPI0037A61022
MRIAKTSASLVAGVAVGAAALAGTGAAQASTPSAQQAVAEPAAQVSARPWHHKTKGAQSAGQINLTNGRAKGWVRDTGPGDGKCAYVKITWISYAGRQDHDVRKDCAGVKRHFKVRGVGDGPYYPVKDVFIKTYRK